MIIDFHTHIFPDRIAEKAIPKLSSIIRLAPSMNGTADGLRASMNDAGIDVSVVLPVVTDPGQFDSIFRFAVNINETFRNGDKTGILSLAGIHPQSDNYKEQLSLIAREGFAGIKLHPNYQNTPFDDIRYMRILYTASELGLSVVTHTGLDPYTPDQIFCSPDRILHVLDEVAPARLILAHMGSNENYDESEAKLCGKNVFFDTAYSLMHMSEEQLVRMIRLHGADRILFASDAPWTSQKECADRIQNLSALSQDEKNLILYENARSILNL